MKIRKIKKLKVNCYEFNIIWNKSHNGGSFSYRDNKVDIGIRDNSESEIFMIICHELMEIVALEQNVRLNRPDCDSDYIFVYDHRQHESMMNLFSSLVSQFIA